MILSNSFEQRVRNAICDLLNRNLLDKVDDERYLKLMWLIKMGYPLDLEHPRTFDEKIQWIKLYDRKPIYTVMSDKLASKEFVKTMIGEEYVVPIYGKWETFDDIDFESLPEQFVLKTNHDNAGVYIVKDKSKLDKDKARKFLEKHLRTKFYKRWREWAYQDIKPMIFAEKYLDGGESGMIDYKFWCFDGEPKFIYTYVWDYEYKGYDLTYGSDDKIFKRIPSNRHKGIQTYYDMDGNLLPWVRFGLPSFVSAKVLPQHFELMKKLSRTLSSGCPFLRVDFFELAGKVYLGELTVYPTAGMDRFYPDYINRKVGDMIHLPEK